MTHPPKPVEADDAWQSTRAQTALATRLLSEDDAATPDGDVGQPTSAGVRELFVACGPALAMRQQFEHLKPVYIAVHDIGCTASARLLSAVAVASGGLIHRLMIRRHGHGTLLATLEFVELPTAVGRALRMYTTHIDADSAVRRELAHTLLAFSRLGVIALGNLPAHAMASALKPLRDEIGMPSWHNRHLLLLPLASGSVASSQALELARGTAVDVRTSPPVGRPAEAWGFINDTWARVGAVEPPKRDPVPLAAAEAAVADRGSIEFTAQAPADASTRRRAAPALAQSLPMRPMPPLPQVPAAPDPPTLWERYTQRLSELPGMVSCCVFELQTGIAVAHAGAMPTGADLGSHGAELMASLASTSRTLGLGHSLPEAGITLGAHHLLLRGIPGQPGHALHAVLDKSHANLTLARLQVVRLDGLFDAATAALPAA
ncbi:MAG: hypothetical protein ABI809_05015 [Caldimonas sp.]